MVLLRRSTKAFALVFLFFFFLALHVLTPWHRKINTSVKLDSEASPTVNQSTQRDLVIVITQSKDMWMLRETIGSIHRHNIEASIRVFTSTEHLEDLEEISTWKNVTAIDIGLEMYNRVGKHFKNINPCILYDKVRHGQSLYLPIGVALKQNADLSLIEAKCLSTQEWIATGMAIVPKYADNVEFRRNRNACVIQHKSEVVQVPEMIRSEVSRFLNADHEKRVNEWTGRRIALLVPTYNKHNGTFYLTSAFIPSLKTSISSEELQNFMVTLYIGYDINDPVVDLPLNDLLPHGNFAVKLHRLPSIRWATAMWNILYNDAMMDGNDYFLQVGDDVYFNEPGWITAMTNELDSLSGVGLVGPRDTKWNCKMMTQAMVTRKHHEIFGWLYPPEIKDWFSDNWIQTTYVNVHRTRCLSKYSVTNKSNMKERYDACDNVDIANMALRKYLPKLSRYIYTNRIQ